MEDLLEFLRRAACTAQVVDHETVLVEVPGALGEEQARMEVALYLKAWQASHPDVEAQLLDIPRSSVQNDEVAAD